MLLRAFFGHAVSETNEDLKALIAAATAFQDPWILIPTDPVAVFSVAHPQSVPCQ